jgi:hypothetical protein
MYNNNDFGKKVSEEQAEFEDRDVWTDKLEGIPVGQEMGNPGQLMAEASIDEDGIAELRPTREQEKAGERDYDWTQDPNLDHPAGRTLAEEEQMLGEEAEMERQRERAVAAHERGIDRARSCREQSEREARERTRAFSERMQADPEVESRTDPRSELDGEVLAECNKDARRVANVRPCAPSPAALSRQLAEHRANGKGALAALMAVQDDLDTTSGVPRELETFESWMAKEKYELRVTVQATVERLYEPNDTGQQQVAILDDGTERAKVTVWRKAQQDTLMQVGDTVRVTNGIAGWYNGQAQVAVDSDTRISIIERGDGAATHRVDGTVFGAAFNSNTDDEVEPPAPSNPSEYEGPRLPSAAKNIE